MDEIFVNLRLPFSDILQDDVHRMMSCIYIKNRNKFFSKINIKLGTFIKYEINMFFFLNFVNKISATSEQYPSGETSVMTSV